MKKIVLALSIISLILIPKITSAQLQANDTNFYNGSQENVEEIAESAFDPNNTPTVEVKYLTAKIINFNEEIKTNPISPDDQPIEIKTAVLQILDTGYEEKELEIPWVEGEDEKTQNTIKADEGDKIIIQCTKVNDTENCSVVDRERNIPIWFLFILFVAVTYFVNKWYGIRAIIGLLFTSFVIIKFMLPQIASGADPVFISIVSIAIFIIPTMLFTHGLKVKTYVAIIGVIFSVFIVALIAKLSLNWANVIGIANEESLYINLYSDSNINLIKLLLAGIMLGTVGVMNDIALTQTSMVEEFKKSHPTAAWKEIFKKAMIVGNDHISSVINTLFLAYIGASLPLILLIQQQEIPFGIALQREFIATEIIRILASTIALVLTVPLTTVIAALVAEKFNLRKFEYSPNWNNIKNNISKLLKKN